MYVLFSQSTALAPSGDAVLVWCPVDALGQTFLRERDRLRPLMRKWSERAAADHDAGPGAQLKVRSFAANTMNVAIGPMGASLTFSWVSPMKFAQKQKSIDAEPVLEVRLPSQICARMWTEVDAVLGGELSSNSTAKEPDAGGA